MSDQIETRRRSLGRSMHDLYTISFFPNLVNICVISREIQSGNTVHAASIYILQLAWMLWASLSF